MVGLSQVARWAWVGRIWTTRSRLGGWDFMAVWTGPIGPIDQGDPIEIGRQTSYGDVQTDLGRCIGLEPGEQCLSPSFEFSLTKAHKV